MKRYLFVLQHPPHSGCRGQEMLDVILTTAAFEQQVALLLVDDAVFQLKTQQHAEKYGDKETLALFNALALYDVQPIYVELESLQERGLTVADLNLAVELVARQHIAQLFAQADVIFSG